VASEDTQASPRLADSIEDAAKEFAFAQAVRLLESLHTGAGSIGGGKEAGGKEPVRFVANPSLLFPCTDIQSIIATDCGQHQVMVNFMGLFGPASPLPPLYSVEAILNEDVRDFLDFFNHRLLALFYRSCTKYRHYLRGEEGLRDFEEMLFALMGLRGDKDRPVDDDQQLLRSKDLRWERLLPLAGLVSMRGHSATVVAMAVSHYFDGIPVSVHEFATQWIPVPDDRKARLYDPNSPCLLDCCLLGLDDSWQEPGGAVLGDQAIDAAGKVCIKLGPLAFSCFVRFLPGWGDWHDELFRIVRFLLRAPVDFDVEIFLGEIPQDLELGLGSENCRLGLTSWLGISADTLDVIESPVFGCLSVTH